jgi:WD40 repeat protein
MGGFYGSVQVKTTDRDRVRSALEELARSSGRFLLGPVLNGWVGVYPEGGGQDFDVARDLAQRLGGELIASLVHDDDIFAYEYHRDGELVDQYNSIPDYFGEEVSEAERQELAGRPETMAHLASDPEKFATFAQRMAAQAETHDPFASGLLEEFAEALGIRNAMTSYEYLKVNEEVEDIEGWDLFVHIPALTEERAQKETAEAAIVEEKERLTTQGKLLAERGGIEGGWASPTPWWCPAPDGRGFLVAWSHHGDAQEQKLPLERHGPPWPDGPQTTAWAIGPHVYGMELSPSGRYLAVAHAAGDWKATLWDLEENRLVVEVNQVRAVSSVGFVADESAMYSVSSHGEDGKVIVTPIGPGEPRVVAMPNADLAATHPREASLVVTDKLNRMHVLDLTSLKIVRTHPIGGRFTASVLENQIVANLQASLSTADSEAIHDQVGGPQEESAELPFGKGISVDDLRKQLEGVMAGMREQFARQPAEQANRGAEKAFRVRFDRDGEWLFVATMGGVRVYAWRDLLDANDLRPTFSADLPSLLLQTDGGEIPRSGYIYDLHHDTDRNRLLFAGLDGRVRFLDLASGKSGVLLNPPGLPAIVRLGLSRDRGTLALTCTPDMLVQSSKKRGPALQFWNYEAISEGS